MSDAPAPRRTGFWRLVGPGLLVAATGVGAGDLATGALTGSKLGVAVMWAVVVGAFLKFVLNEGLTRWQLATGTTVLEGAARNFGAGALSCFLIYLLIWSYLVGAALISASGAVSHAIFPIFANPDHDKLLYGSIHSAAAVALLRGGGFRLFARLMHAGVAVMFVVVAVTAVALRPDWSDVVQGLFLPTIPDLRGEGLSWTIALMGGVGGTVTILCYGYWIREAGIGGDDALRSCRIDLAAGYFMTAVFGVSMIVIGSRIGPVEGGGVKLCVQVSQQLLISFGPGGAWFKWFFLAGAWCAIFTSLLGVWQSVPYLFADCWRLLRAEAPAAYRGYQIGLAVLPLSAVALVPFTIVQKSYAIVGACFIPILSVALLVLNGREQLVGRAARNRWQATAVLLAALAIFIVAAILEIQENL